MLLGAQPALIAVWVPLCNSSADPFNAGIRVFATS